MAAGILIVTHGEIGTALIDTVRTLLNDPALQLRSFSVPLTYDTDSIRHKLCDLCRETDQGDGVLILTDLYGATPDNTTTSMESDCDTCVVSGVNLPMLLKVINYRTLPLSELADKARQGGCNGIVKHR